jgi:hypothetical protein
MKNKLFILLGMIMLSTMIIHSVSAACILQGYTKDINGNRILSFTPVYCQNEGSWSNSTGTSYFASFGGPADSCLSRCGNVYIKSEHKSSIPEEPYLVGYPNGYFPLNSTNTAGWSSGSAHNINITLSNLNTPKPSPVYKPISQVQQKANQEQAINQFNSVITTEYKKDNLNVNKVQSLMEYNKLPVNISLVKEPFWIIWWNAIKQFLGVK